MFSSIYNTDFNFQVFCMQLSQILLQKREMLKWKSHQSHFCPEVVMCATFLNITKNGEMLKWKSLQINFCPEVVMCENHFNIDYELI